MSPVEAFLQRLQQHIQSQQGPDLGNVPVLSGLAEAVLRPAYNAAGTIGLGLEGTAKLGNYAAGETVLGAEQAQQNLHQLLPAIFTSPGDPNVIAQGPLHPQAALDAARNGPDSMTAWLAGALAMAADPANLIPLPFSHAAQAEKAANAVARQTARAGFSDEFMQGLMQELQQNAAAHDAALAKQAILGNTTPEQALAQQAQAGNLAAVSDRVNAVANRTKAYNQWAKAVGDYQNAASVYDDVQAQKAAALKDALDPYRVNGHLPRGFKNTPEYQQVADETKNAVELLNPQGPQQRATFQEFMRQQGGALKAAKAAADDANSQLQQAFAQPSSDFLQQALDQGTQVAAPTGATPLEAALPQAAPVKNTDIAGLNEKLNAEELATTPTRTPDESGWFAAPDPSMGDPAQNPIKAAATQVANPVKAQDGSVPTQEPGYVSHVWDLIKTALLDPSPQTGEPSTLAHFAGLAKAGLQQGIEDTKASYSQPFKRLGLRDVAGVWSGINIETLRNFLMDPAYSRTMLANEGIQQRWMSTAAKVMGQRVKAGETNPVALLGPIADYLGTLGTDITQLEAKVPQDAQQKLANQIVQDLGGNFARLEADNANRLATMNGLQKALVGTGLQVANPVTAVTGVLTAPLNLLMDMRHALFQIMNNTTHMSARTASFEAAFLPFIENSAKDLLARAASEGKDVSMLANRGFGRYGETLATDGAFSPAEVTAQLGERYGAEWGRMAQQALDAGYANSKRVLGNFADTSPAEDTIRRFVPFMSWSWRAYPRAAKMALEHPALGIGLLHLYAADRAMAQAEGRPGYQVGTLAINKDTPLLGLLASVFTPEQEATVRLNPLALFSPVSGDLLAAGMDQQQGNQTPYETAKNLVGMAGGSFNPLIQTGAYIIGQDYQAPGAASRYAPVDVLTAQMGGPSVPTIQGPLRALRKLVTGQADTYDPIEAKAKELVFERTGKPVSDPSNKKLAQEINDKTGIYQDAYRDYAQGGAGRAVFNALSPVSVQATTATTEARRAANVGMPFSYDDIQQAKQMGLAQLVTAMQQANDTYVAQNPAAAVNKDATLTAQEKEDPRLRAWENLPENKMLAGLAPAQFAKRKAAYKATLGIK